MVYKFVLSITTMGIVPQTLLGSHGSTYPVLPPVRCFPGLSPPRLLLLKLLPGMELEQR